MPFDPVARAPPMDAKQTGSPIGREEQTDDERPGWICVDCQTPNPVDAKQCVKCGYVLSAHTPTPGSGPVAERLPDAVDASTPLPPPTLLPTPTSDGQAVADGRLVMDRAGVALVPIVEESAVLPSEAGPALPADESAHAPPTAEPIEVPPAEPDEVPPPVEAPESAPPAVAIVTQPAPPPVPDSAPAPVVPEPVVAELREPVVPARAASVTRTVPVVPSVLPVGSGGTRPPASPVGRRVDARPRQPGRLARTAPETLLLIGALVSLVAWALIALDETTGETGLVGLVGLGLGAGGIYVLAVGLIQAVLRRGGRRF
jgi:hypothetical protein